MKHKTKFTELNQKFSHYHKIYINASKLNEGVGYAIITENKTIKPQMTIFSAEAYVIYATLKHIQWNTYINNTNYTGSMRITKTPYQIQ